MKIETAKKGRERSYIGSIVIFISSFILGAMFVREYLFNQPNIDSSLLLIIICLLATGNPSALRSKYSN